MTLRTVIETPYAGDVAGNTQYARACMADSLRRGEAPFLSHLLYPLVLDDTDATERAQGMMAGYAWMRQADQIVFYTDRGLSAGMAQALEWAKRLGKPVVERRLDPDFGDPHDGQGAAPERNDDTRGQ